MRETLWILPGLDSRKVFPRRESRGLPCEERERVTTKIHYFTVGTYVEFRGDGARRIPRGILRESNLHKTINKTRLISVLALTDIARNVYYVVTLEISTFVRQFITQPMAIFYAIPLV